MGDERPKGIALILRAIDLTIADVEERESSDREQQLAQLRQLRERWAAQLAAEESG